MLHVAANNGNCEMAEHFISEYKKINNKESSLGTWVNLKDSEGFTCLHYASFRGNYRLVKLFEENGADLSQVNGEGLTVLHIAAQGDSPLLIVHMILFSIIFLTRVSRSAPKTLRETLLSIGLATAEWKTQYLL